MGVDEMIQTLKEEDVSKQKPDTEPLKQFTVEILKLIKDAQQQHGLRHSDYQRYRGYCSRRISRLRKVLKVPQGDRRHFKKRDITNAHVLNPRSDERFLHIPLMLSERCWAYAMQLRQEANTEPRKKFHLIQKLRKSCVYALQFDELCKQDRCDARTKLEAQAYVSWIHGTLQFELQLWQQAAENLKKAQVIYEKLASTLPEEEQLPYRQRVEEIAPSLRYCAYNIGDEKAVDLLELRSQGVLDNFDALVSQTKEKTADVLYEIKWFDLDIPVRIERIRLFLVSIEGLDESLVHAEDNQSKIKILENLFIDLRDVISLARDSARNDKTNTVLSKQMKEYQLLLSYLLSIRIERTSQRNLLLITQTRKPQDCVRLLDINIQQTNELSQNDTIKENGEAQKYYDSYILAYKTLRSYYLAKTQVSQKHWREAAVLFDTASKSVRNLQKGDFIGELQYLLKIVEEKAASDLAIAQANFILDKPEDQAIQFPQKVYKRIPILLLYHHPWNLYLQNPCSLIWLSTMLNFLIYQKNLKEINQSKNKELVYLDLLKDCGDGVINHLSIMDSRNSRSRSKTPFTQMEFPTEDLTEKLIHSEKTTIRTTRRTALRLGETIAASAENVSLKMEKPLRKSTRSERTVHKWHKTSDYSSEDGENEVSSAQTMTQNEKNQLVEDARAAANGTDEVSALNLYKKSGRYWDVYPKTDWTYSPHSKDRIELAPGVVAMPNMSRKTIHSVHTTDSSYDFAHKETNTEAVSRWNVAQSYAEYMPRKLFNNNYDDEYRSEKNTSFIRNQWIKLKRSLTSVFISVVTILYFIFEVQTYWFAKLHTFTSRVMLLDTWLLLKNGVGNKTRKLTALCLVPLILLGGLHVLLVSGVSLAPSCHPNCRHIASAYLNSLINDAYNFFNITD
ncbi:hypothetical protein JTB14_035481 [Gonioctena quinquepunctata]|nr:hypothetical protein JTB14_035481 [Gonioctena quinquepunctata]